MAENQKDLVLAPGEYAYIMDSSKALVSAVVGPFLLSLGANQYPVLWQEQERRFRACEELSRARQPFVSVPEGHYVILEAPAPDVQKHPPESANNTTTPELGFGRRINIAGPAHFPLWPRQTARVIAGHQLRSNEYLIVRVYNDKQAASNWDAAVVQPQTGQGDTNPDQPARVLNTIPRPDPITMGQLIVINGTAVSFYIPPTGIEVLPSPGSTDTYVRKAVTLERLEYCILLDEDGNKRYVQGPAVVFPEPTETFVETEGNVKFRVIELNKICGLYVKVIADYTESDHEYHTGDELFITGEQQAIYMPRPEHSIISYGNKQIHFAVAVPAGEGRYVLNRLTGQIDLVTGPAMLLPDPRTHVIVRRVLDPKAVVLLYPGNATALMVNQKLAEISERLQPGEYFTQEAMEQATLGVRTRGARTQVASERVVSDQFDRGTSFSQPRTVTLDTKYDGAVMVNVWTGYAVLITDNVGNRRVVVGPQTVLLAYNENLMAMELSTGTPKSDENPLKTVYLRVSNNRISDKVRAETVDLCAVSLTLSYRVNFEGDNPERWFAVENYVKFLTDHLRSLIRNIARQHGIEEFYRDAINIVRDAILGTQQDGRRTGRLFQENNMRVYEIEVLDVAIENPTIARLLVDAQHETVQATLQVVAAEQDLLRTKRIEMAKRGTAEEKAATVRRDMELEIEAVQIQFEAALAQVNLQAEQDSTSDQLRLGRQGTLAKISKAELEREKTSVEQDIALEQKRIEQELKKLQEETVEFVKRAGAVSPDLIAALQAFGDKEMIAKMSQAMAPLTYLGGGSVAEIVGKIFEGTPLGATLANLLLAGNHVALPARE